MARLLHVVSSNQRRGAEVFGVELAEALAPHGHSVEVVAVSRAPAGPYLEISVAGGSRWSPIGLGKLSAAARKSDVVIGFGGAALQAGALSALLARRPFIYRSIGDPRRWHDVRAASLRLGAPLKHASAVVAVFPQARLEFIRRFELDPDKVTVIPRGVPANRFPVTTSAERTEARRHLGLDNRPWLVFVGSLTEEKAPLRAIDAVLAHPTAGLIVCGDGPLLGKVRERAAAQPERLHLQGPVVDVRPSLRAADAIILSSDTEGVPGAVVEAGMTGLPAIASAVGGVPFLVRDSETGILVNPDFTRGFTDAIDSAVRGGASMGMAAAQRCRQEFSMDVVAAKWAGLIHATLNR